MEQKILDYLKYMKNNKLAYLLEKCTYEFNQSNSYGSGYNKYKTELILYSDIITFEKLSQISEEDQNIIIESFNAMSLVYDDTMDLCCVNYCIDPEKEIPINNLKIRNNIEKISFDYALEQIQKIEEKIQNDDYDGAVTNSRTLLETILKSILEKEQISFSNRDNLIILYKKVAELLNLNPKDHTEEYFKKILSGFFSIIQGISEIRNKFSDAHGKSNGKYYKLHEHHAKLTIDATKSIANYLVVAYNHKTGNTI